MSDNYASLFQRKLPLHLGGKPSRETPNFANQYHVSALSQDESRSISENSTWGIRRRFEQGRLFINTTKFLGYDKDKNGNLVINEKQAKIVKRIYREFLDGKGANRIARDLGKDRVPNGQGKAKWYESSVRKILTNEKYKGDALLQKTYTVCQRQLKNDPLGVRTKS